MIKCVGNGQQLSIQRRGRMIAPLKHNQGQLSFSFTKTCNIFPSSNLVWFKKMPKLWSFLLSNLALLKLWMKHFVRISLREGDSKRKKERERERERERESRERAWESFYYSPSKALPAVNKNVSRQRHLMRGIECEYVCVCPGTYHLALFLWYDVPRSSGNEIEDLSKHEKYCNLWINVKYSPGAGTTTAPTKTTRLLRLRSLQRRIWFLQHVRCGATAHR